MFWLYEIDANVYAVKYLHRAINVDNGQICPQVQLQKSLAIEIPIPFFLKISDAVRRLKKETNMRSSNWKWLVIACLAVLSMTATLSAEIKVLAFSGSTREASFNKKLLIEAANIAKAHGAKVTLVSLKDFQMPFYDGDEESAEGMPPQARRFRKLMIDNQVILIASPEYNGSLSAVLKNALDWASRGEAGGSSKEAFAGKTFLMMSASPGKSGGVRGLQHLKTVIENAGGQTMPQTMVVPNAYEAFDVSGKLKSSELQAALTEFVTKGLSSSAAKAPSR